MQKTIYPITRIEGHADIELELDEKGRFQSVRLLIGSFRGFEKLLEGRPVEEVPRIVTRICGLCPWSHHLASLKAIEKALGIEVPKRAYTLRRLSFLISHIQDKILHFFLLSLPDFLSMSQGREIRGLGEILRIEPEMARRALEAKKLCFHLLELLGGKAIHPVSMLVGGVALPPDRDGIRKIKRSVKRLLEFSRWAISYSKEKFFIPLKEIFWELPCKKTGFLGTVNEDGWIELYQGDLKLLGPEGEMAIFKAEEYGNFLVEEEADWSYSKLVKTGCWRSEEGGRGLYRVNALSRLVVSKGLSTKKAKEEFGEFLNELGPNLWHPMNYHWARLIEMLYCAEEALQLLEGTDLLEGPALSTKTWEPQGEGGASTYTGVGCIEAPRGTLIHHYEIDSKGILRKANLIVGTTHNIAPMAEDAKTIARWCIDRGDGLEQVKAMVSLIVRAHDP